MIKAVLIDDERPALIELEFLLKSYSNILIVGKYANPLTGINMIERLKPEVVFLDVNMPQLKGTDAASRILDFSPETDIVFVTAFDEYAVEAFEINALDYILKPIDQERLEKTIKRIMARRKTSMQKKNENRLQIKCLGGLKVAWENQEPLKWRAEKTKELFAFLIQNQGRYISKEVLLDTLWTDEDPEKAIRQLYNGVYYIRKALELYGVGKELIGIDRDYYLKLGSVEFDVLYFNEFEKGNHVESIGWLEKLADLYTGDYLEDQYYPWADIERERLLKLYMQCIIKLSKKYMEEKQWDKAENILFKAYNKNPYDEIITELLMMLYIQTRNRNKALTHFNKYLNLLKEELNVEPNKKIRELAQFAKKQIRIIQI